MPKSPFIDKFETYCLTLHSMYRFPYHRLSSGIYFHRYNSFKFYTLPSKDLKSLSSQYPISSKKSDTLNFWHLSSPTSTPKPTIFYDKKNHFQITQNRLESSILKAFLKVRKASPDKHNK